LPLTQLSGVGPAVLQRFVKMGLETVEDLLYCLPHRYEDRREIRKIAQLRDGYNEVFAGEILVAGEMFTRKARRRIYEVIVNDGSGQVSLKWFHYKKNWMKQRFAVGRKAFFIGEIKRFGAVREVHHPDVEFLKENETYDQHISSDTLSFGRILPVYPLTEGLHQKTARKIWKDAVDRFSATEETCLPPQLIEKRQLLPISEALHQAHWPAETSSIQDLNSGVDAGRRTLVYDEFFFLELGMALKRRGVIVEQGIPFQVNHKYTKPLVDMLPFKMTDAQRRVLGEIKHDLMQPHPMNRMVQGDVGCGKTVVALMTALVAIENSCQVAIVAPTEILAEQHYRQFLPWMQQLGLETLLLTGSMTARIKKESQQKIADGSVDLVVGTHAVLQDGVEFRRLGLGIVDEQHRFGVKQRAVLKRKGENPHILVMTATPIPRTLAMTVFGDLSLSVIDQLPPGRTPVKTVMISEGQKSKAYQKIREQVAKGLQAYIVYPLVEESEKSDLLAACAAFENMKTGVFSDLQIGLLHGQLKAEEKDEVMTAFKAGKIDVLLSTTVIEVGVDVPKATIMMIEHAERFGLSQLHQLRGRVGRGADISECLLIKSNNCSEDGLRRLQTMCETNDGFKIAEVDLEMRGPGEFLGTRQSGIPDFRIANLLRDTRVLEEAREDAFEMANRPEFLTSDQYTRLRETLKKRWGTRLQLANIG
jgi:ATP-dependent DNA helicase RecG